MIRKRRTVYYFQVQRIFFCYK